MRRLILTILAACSIAAGCAGLTGGGFATNEDIRGPWRAQPLSVDRATIEASEQACRLQESDLGVQGLATSGRLVAVDARGGGSITLLYVGPGESYLACQVDVSAGGSRSMGGSSGEVGGPPRVLAANDVVILGTGGMSGGAESSSSVVGRIGSDVVAVRIVLSSGSAIQASVGGGWFTAWWPSAELVFVVEAFDASGKKISQVEQ